MFNYELLLISFKFFKRHVQFLKIRKTEKKQEKLLWIPVPELNSVHIWVIFF